MKSLMYSIRNIDKIKNLNIEREVLTKALKLFVETDICLN